MEDQINQASGDGRLIRSADPRLFPSSGRRFDLFTVARSLAEHTFTLPVGQPAGDLLIGMVDTDRSPGGFTMGGVEIDHPYVESVRNGDDPGLILEAAVVGSKRGTTVTLTWTNIAAVPYVVRRDSAVIASAVNATTHVDCFGMKDRGTFAYRVCDSTDAVCSNAVTIESWRIRIPLWGAETARAWIRHSRSA